MRAYLAALLAITISVTGPAFAQSMGNMPGMDHPAQAAKTGRGTGVITAIDRRASTLTIQHGPNPAIGWPAMTMVFNATPSTLLNGRKVGQKIAFDVRAQGMAAEVTGIRPQ